MSSVMEKATGSAAHTTSVKLVRGVGFSSPEQRKGEASLGEGSGVLWEGRAALSLGRRPKALIWV